MQAHAGLPLIGPDGQQVKRFHAYGPQWADMAEGSGYETVVHKQPLLRWVCYNSVHCDCGITGRQYAKGAVDGLQGRPRHREERVAVLLKGLAVVEEGQRRTDMSTWDCAPCNGLGTSGLPKWDDW